MPPAQLVLENVTPATRLLEKRRQMFEVQEALEHQKQEYATREENFRKREEDLKKRDLDLQETLLKFTKFLQDNDAKRAKANKRAQDEIKLREEKEREIDSLLVERMQLENEKNEVDSKLQQIIKYQHYLQSVVDSADSFQEVEDILIRYSTLELANKDLQHQHSQRAECAESVRSDAAEYIKTQSNEALNLNNKVSVLKKKLQLLHQDAAALEARQENSMQVAAQNSLELGQLCMSTNNIYQRCLQKSKVAHAEDETNPLIQLEAVGNFVSDLREAIQQYTR